uniref:Coiled-coil domain-containing protein 102B-like n=1 Tax=Dromaius novaehollandiae TaxID=8790 RepID=A0A8C4J1V3_DRONO
MNLSSAQKLTEERQDFKAQPRQPYELAGGSQPASNLCNSNLPSQSFYPYSSHYPCVYINNSSNWEIYEAIRIRELEEVKARAAQMEKTMRWWSDCTANWREKWSKVRAERNKAREEARQLRIKLEIVVKELSRLKKINQDLSHGRPCRLFPFIYAFLRYHVFLFSQDVEVVKEVLSNQNKKITPKLPDSFPKGVSRIYLEEPKKSLDNTTKTSENDLIHVSVLHLHLAELQKILRKEREMNVFLEKEVEKMENDLSLWKWKYEELKQSKLENRHGRVGEEMKVSLRSVELSCGIANSLIKSLWLGVGGEASKSDVVVGVCHRLPDKEANKLLKKVKEVSELQSLVFMGGSCWKDNMAGCRQSKGFLENVRNNFLL